MVPRLLNTVLLSPHHSVQKYSVTLVQRLLKLNSQIVVTLARTKEPFLNDSPGLEHSGLFQYLNMNKLGDYSESRNGYWQEDIQGIVKEC